MDLAALLGPYGLTVGAMLVIRHLLKDNARLNELYLEARTRNDKIPQLLTEQTAAFLERDRERDARIDAQDARIDGLTKGLKLLANMRPSDRPGAYSFTREGGQ